MAGPAPILIGEAFSPWTQKARWALEACGVGHVYEEYAPVLGEPRLRWRTGHWTGRATVPVLLDGNRVIPDSWSIVLHANARSPVPLIRDLVECARWNARCDAACAEARQRVLRRISTSTVALDEAVVGILPWAPPGLRRAAALAVIRRLQRKYAGLGRDGALREALLQGRRQLQGSGTGFLSTAFGFPDIALAVVVEVIAPRARTARGPATLACWSDHTLTSEFTDVVRWRDGLADTPFAWSHLRGDAQP